MRFGVVAVTAAGGPAVAVHIEALVDRAAAVVVHEVAHLDGAGVDGRVALPAVGRAAVGRAGEVAVTVGVEPFEGRRVAVVVEAVWADRRGPCVDRRFGVVTVACTDRHAVAVDIEPLVGGAVAVVVDPVADLGGARVDRAVEVVAVARAGPHAVAVHVGVDVHPSDAVVVEAVAADLDLPGVDQRVVVVAVAAALRDAVVVRVVLRGKQDPVAVVVQAVADLGRCRVDARVAVVAVVAGERAVAVHVEQLAGQELTVAVVVDAVAELGRAGVHRRIVVVAVEAVLDVVAVAVPVGLADDPVAVEVVWGAVVLLRAGEGVLVGVVAVALADPPAVGVGVLLGGGRQPVAVVVLPVAQLHGEADPDQEVAVVAVALAFGLSIEVVVHLLGHVAVAVLVGQVAVLRRARVVGGVRVEAVALADADPVAVCVGLVGRHGARAAVVLAVALLGRPRVLQRVERVAVTAVGVAVPVVVDVVAVADAVPVGVLRAAGPQVHGFVVATASAVDPAEGALGRLIDGTQQQTRPPVVGHALGEGVGQERRGLPVDVGVQPAGGLDQAGAVEGHPRLLDLELDLHVASPEGRHGLERGLERGAGRATPGIDLPQGHRLQRPRGPGEGRRGARVVGVAEEQGGQPLVVRAVVGAADVTHGRADDHVVAAVAVHVARAGHREAQRRAGLAGERLPVVGAVARPAEPDQGLARVRVPRVGASRSDHHVRPAVAVHVAGPVHRAAQLVVGRGPAERDQRRSGHRRRVAGVDQRPARPGPDAGVSPPTDDHVRQVIGVEVADARHRVTVLPARAPARAGPVLRRRQPPGRAQEDRGLARRPEAVVPARHPDDQVVDQVPVHVSRAVQGVAELVAAVAACHRPAGRRGQARRRAVEHQRRADVAARGVPQGSARGHVGEAVPVHVPGARHREAESVAGLGADEAPGGRGGRGRAARHQEHSADAARAVRPAGGAHGDVPEAVAVHVADPSHGVAEAGVGLAPGQLQPGGGVQAGRRTGVHVDPPLVRQGRLEVGGADHHVVEAVRVDVAGGLHREAELVAGCAALLEPVRGAADVARDRTRGAAREQLHGALVQLDDRGSVAVRRPDQQVREPVAVDVAAVEGLAEARVLFTAQQGPVGGRGGGSGGIAVPQERLALGVGRAVPAVGPHQEVGVAVAVDVARLGDLLAEPGGGAADRRTPAPAVAGGEAADAAVVEPGAAVGAPVGGPHQNVRVAVAVHVADPGHRAAVVGAARRSRGDRAPGLGGDQSAEAAVEDVGPADVGVVRVAHHQVAVAVAVYVAGGVHRPAEVHRAGRREGPVRAGGHRAQGGRAIEDVDLAPGAQVHRRAHRQVAVAVPVQVAGAGDGPAEVAVVDRAAELDHRTAGDPGGGALVDPDRALLVGPVLGQPHDQLDEAVAVEVAAVHRGSHPGLGVVRLPGLVRRDRRTRGRSVEELDQPLPVLALVAPSAADGHVLVAVAVRVPDHGHGPAELGPRVGTLKGPQLVSDPAEGVDRQGHLPLHRGGFDVEQAAGQQEGRRKADRGASAHGLPPMLPTRTPTWAPALAWKPKP